MVTDQEPRYRLVDADGNVVGSLFAESDGTLKLQEGTSGNDNELSLTTQGALNVEQFSRGIVWKSVNKSVDTVYTAGDTDRFVSIKFEFDSTNRTAARLVADVNGGPEKVADEVTKDSPNPNDTFTLSGPIPAGVDYELRNSGDTITVVDWDEAD